MASMHVMGSFSSSEDELATTPEYTSCEEHEREWPRPPPLTQQHQSIKEHDQRLEGIKCSEGPGGEPELVSSCQAVIGSAR